LSLEARKKERKEGRKKKKKKEGTFSYSCQESQFQHESLPSSASSIMWWKSGERMLWQNTSNTWCRVKGTGLRLQGVVCGV
jgi:hypothetical protein